MATYKTPGVYIEEVSTFPPSVAEVSTAVPAFLGYTEKGPEVARISTLLEYEELFGKADGQSFVVTTTFDEASKSDVLDQINKQAGAEFLLYYSVALYFKNGGGACYVFSTGHYRDVSGNKNVVALADFSKSLQLVEKEDEPTLIVFPDATTLGADYYTLCQDALALCKKLGDRFALFDVPMSGDGVQSDAAEFRNNLSSPYQLYGAAYYPHIQTAITYQYNESDIVIETTSPTGNAWSKTFSDEDISLTVTSSDEDGAPSVYITKGSKDAALEISLDAEQLKLSNASGTTGNELVEAWAAWTDENDTQGFDLEVLGDADVGVLYTKSVLLEKTNESTSSVSLKEIASTQTALHNAIKTALAGQRVILPSSPGVVGIYARVDRDRGVWKSPANESLSSVIGPMLKITNEEQENLNVDAMAGKSINAVRQFTGKGTLVWGARTLAGNDNEWRYISVRRLFNMIEESTQKASAFAVFEPNDASTWLKVKAMIESYLYSLWEKGALAGSTQEAAFYVNVGLGKTMTTDDVLNGRMIIEIGVAPVRPAEFIIIRFSHKLQEA